MQTIPGSLKESRQAGNDLPVLILGEGTERFRANSTLCSQGEVDTGECGVIGRLDEDRHVVLTHQHVEALQLSAGRFDGFFAGFQAGGALL